MRFSLDMKTLANVRRHTKQPHNVKQRVNLTHDVLRYLRVKPRTNNEFLPAADALQTARTYRNMRNSLPHYTGMARQQIKPN